MRAVITTDSPEGKLLELADIPQPVPGPTDLLVRIRAAGLNRSDLDRTQKHYPPSQVHVAGREMSGEVVHMGCDVADFRLGDRVMGLANGTYAEFTCIDHRLAMRVPENLSWEAAAAVPANFLTAHNALRTAGRLALGESVLIHAVTSGVGIAAVQVARQLGASKIIGTTRNPRKAAPLKELGLDAIVDTRQHPCFSQLVHDQTAGKGANVIVDLVGAQTLHEIVHAAAIQGRIVLAGLMGGVSSTLDLHTVVLRQIELVGVTFRSRTLEDKQRVNAGFEADLAACLRAGAIRPLLHATYPLAAAAQAQALMAGDAHLGKIVLMP